MAKYGPEILFQVQQLIDRHNLKPETAIKRYIAETGMRPAKRAYEGLRRAYRRERARGNIPIEKPVPPEVRRRIAEYLELAPRVLNREIKELEELEQQAIDLGLDVRTESRESIEQRLGEELATLEPFRSSHFEVAIRHLYRTERHDQRSMERAYKDGQRRLADIERRQELIRKVFRQRDHVQDLREAGGAEPEESGTTDGKTPEGNGKS